MQSLLFTPGQAFLSVDSPIVPWTVVFEDEGVAAYFYACDRSRETHDDAILDAMLIYNVNALKDRETQRLATVQWSRDGLMAALYLDGTAQAIYDFQQKCGFSRLDFPNFIAEQGDAWRKSTHAWSDAVLQHFEASLYAEPTS